MKTVNGLFRSFEGSGERGWIRLGLAVAAMSAYILAFIPPFTPEEYRIVELAATPVVVFAWLFGFWGGAAAVIIIPFNAFLFSLVADEAFGTVMSQLQRDELLPGILLLVLGAVLGGLRDVADQMRRESLLRAEAEAAGREREERYRFLTEASSDGIVTIDADGMLLSVNGAAEKIFGSSGADLVGRPFRDLIPERVREDHEAVLRRYLDMVVTGQTGSALQIGGLDKDGREIVLESSFTAHAPGSGRVFTGVVRDVTERTQRQEGARSGADAGSASPGDTVEGAMAAAMASLDPPREPTILYIEDVPPGLEIVEEMRARRPTMEILTVSNGQEGLDLARERTPDLILLDVNLPDMHGSEAMRRIREDSLISRTPVIVIGVDPAADQGAQLLEAGAQACLPVPLEGAELLRTVDAVLAATC